MRDAQDVDVLEKAPASPVSRPLGIAIPVAIAVVIADQITKQWALSALERGPCSTPGNCIDVFAGIKFHLVFNTGAAFTRGSGFGPVLAVLAFFMGGFLLYLATRREDRLGIALFGTVAGGAAGNLVDRVFRADDGLFSGAVVDFIDVGWWPVFNIADMAIVIGVISIIVLTMFEDEPEPEPDDSEQADPGDGTEAEVAVGAETGSDAELDRNGSADGDGSVEDEPTE